MSNLRNNDFVLQQNQIFNLQDKSIENIKEFINTANSRLDAIIAISNNSHAITADAVTTMICESQDSVDSSTCVNTTNKMSVCLRDGEIILRFVTYLLITNDESILSKSCLKDLKNTYISLGVPLPNAIRVVELIRDSTVSEIKTIMNLNNDNHFMVSSLIEETQNHFEKIINLLK